jgi:hypothetical protein
MYIPPTPGTNKSKSEILEKVHIKDREKGFNSKNSYKI